MQGKFLNIFKIISKCMVLMGNKKSPRGVSRAMLRRLT